FSYSEFCGNVRDAPAAPEKRSMPATSARLAPPLRPPARRPLRVFAFDPSFRWQLDTALINEMTLPIVWEPVQPGPIGEYLEVVDYDPASRSFYEPVDLEHPFVLAADGLAPAEGSPQFHQQMVYAVAMTTIRYFETALGRRVLWADHLADPGPPAEAVPVRGRGAFVPRLRIYPHAFRAANAYYSPRKKA